MNIPALVVAMVLAAVIGFLLALVLPPWLSIPVSFVIGTFLGYMSQELFA